MDENENKKGNSNVLKNILLMVIAGAIVFVFTSTYYLNSIAAGKYQENVYTETFQKLNRVKSYIDKYFLFDIDEEKIEEGAINGMLEALGDPYTTYFNKEEWEQFYIETEGEYEGVGLYITYDTEKKMVFVITPIENSPAAEADIKTGDYIEQAGDITSFDSDLQGISEALKGKEGSSVVVKFVRYDKDGNATRFEKTLIRRKIELDPVISKVLDKNIGYIKLTSFDETSYAKFLNAYNELINDKKVSGLIIDMRNNPGGLLTIAEKITDIIIPEGKIYYTVDKNGKQEAAYSDASRIEIPLAVLINGGSASCTEIMAAAIKDYGVGKIIGQTSYGKGVVQQLKSLYDGTYMKITICEYFSPNGNKINDIGVVPDIESLLPESVVNTYNLKEDEDTQLKSATEYIESVI